ncbi:MAG: zinc-binding dehydrogenase [Bacteroidetes bacterium]|nr:zinc-binding dehydrogenase [Bacteroidota bacterium]
MNFAETERRRGLYATPALPWCPGSEGAGLIVALGPGADPALLGQRVAFWAMPPAASGTYAEYARVPVNALFHLSDAISFDIGAALPLQGLTAYGLAFFAAKIRTGMSVLVHAAAGGVGQLLVQMVRNQGAHVFATTSTSEKASIVASLGAEPFLYGADLPQRIAKTTEGRGFDLIYDSVGKATQTQSLALLAPYGELVHFGEASGPPQAIHPDQLYERSLKVSAFGLNTERDPAAWAKARRDLLSWVEKGALRVSVSQRLPLAQASEAHRLLESRATTGKVILYPGAG